MVLADSLAPLYLSINIFHESCIEYSIIIFIFANSHKKC